MLGDRTADGRAFMSFGSMLSVDLFCFTPPLNMPPTALHTLFTTPILPAVWCNFAVLAFVDWFAQTETLSRRLCAGRLLQSS